MSTSLETFLEERVLRLTLNRPEKRNALNLDLCNELVEAIENAGADPGIGAILLEAKGAVFCAGMDLAEVTPGNADELSAVHQQLFTVGSRTRKPIVASVAGPALGGGVGLLANAHIVVAAHGVNFGLTEIRIGMWPYLIYPAIRAALGERRALDLSLTGRIFGVPEAMQWGLIAEAVPAIELDDRATAIATHLAAASSQAIEAGLAFVAKSRGAETAEALALGASYRLDAFRTEDFQEGVSAFLQKRRPVWKRSNGSR